MAVFENLGTRHLAAGLLTVLSLADIVTTRFALTHFNGMELNPLIAPGVDTMAVFSLKTLGVALVGFLVAKYGHSRWLINTLYGVTAFYAIVVTSNSIQILVAVLFL